MKVINVIGHWYDELTPGKQKLFNLLDSVLGTSLAGQIMGYKGVLTHEDLGKTIILAIQRKEYERLHRIFTQLTPEEREDAELEEVLQAADVLVEYQLRRMFHERNFDM